MLRKIVLIGLAGLALLLGMSGLGLAVEALYPAEMTSPPRDLEPQPFPFTPTGDTIYYDDGNGSWLYVHQGSRRHNAVRMTPVVPCTLKGMAWYWYEHGHPGPQTCSLYVWNVVAGHPGNVVAGPVPFIGAPWEWIQVDLPAPYPVFSGDFFLGAVMMGPPYGVFDAATTTYRSWYSTNGGITWFNVSGGDLLCRALVEYEQVDIHDVGVIAVENPQGYFMPNPGNAQISAAVRNDGNTPETNFGVECIVRDTTYSFGIVYSDTQTVASLNPGAFVWVAFTPNWQPNADGEYIISVRTLLIGDMNPDNDRFAREAQVCTYPSTLTYDDDESDGGMQWEAGNGHAAKFVPPYYPCRVTSISLSTEAGSVQYLVLDDLGVGGPPGATLVDTTFTGVSGWNTVNISSYDVTINDGCFYVAYIYVDGTTAIDFDSDPPGTDQRWRYEGGTWTQDVLGNDWLIRAGTDWGTGVEEGQGPLCRPSDVVLLENRPNPLATSTTISYHVPVTGRAVLAIYDITGRMVSTLVDAGQEAGYHLTVWNGTDSAGRSVPSGIYFYKLDIHGLSAARKLVVVR